MGTGTNSIPGANVNGSANKDAFQEDAYCPPIEVNTEPLNFEIPHIGTSHLLAGNQWQWRVCLPLYWSHGQNDKHL